MSSRNFVISDVTSVTATGAASVAAATLAADANLYWYVTGFEIYCGGATAGSIILATITGLLGGTMTIPVAVPAGAALAAAPIVVEFTQPLAGAATNTAVSLSLPSAGAGNTSTAVTLHGFKGARQLA